MFIIIMYSNLIRTKLYYYSRLNESMSLNMVKRAKFEIFFLRYKEVARKKKPKRNRRNYNLSYLLIAILESGVINRLN